MKIKRYLGDYPCPGCGKSGTEIFRTSKYALCNNCKELLEIGKSVKALDNKFAGISVNIFNNGNGFIDSRNNNNYIKTTPLVYMNTVMDIKKEGETEKLSKAIYRLVKSCHFANKDSEFELKASDYMGDRFVVSVEFAEAFKEMMDAIGKYSQAIEKEYFNKGKNLLKGLASGDLTLKDFEEE